nr:PREDICTED: uncharacterized protein LOC103312264 isoform X3 [Tribolium castaneum]|eukprot:XP_015833217.1 PREDICTED: uncharacterized protein LOC103312264 isoform X3 [Tribolium castaneum]
MNWLNSSSHCFICASYPISFIVRFVFAVKTYCYHSRPSVSPSYYNSILLSRCVFTATVFLTVKNFLSVFLTETSSFNQFLTLMLLVLDTFAVACVLVNVKLTQNYQIMHFNGILLIIQKRVEQFNKHIVDEMFQAKIYSILFKNCIPFFLVFALILAIIFYSRANFNAETIFEALTVSVIFLVNMSLFVSVLFCLEIYVLLFGKCYIQVKQILGHDNLKSLAKHIQHVQVFHHCVFLNFRLICRIFKVHVILFMFCGCLILVGNFYLFVSYIQECKSYTNEELVRFVLCFFGVFGSIKVLFKLRELHVLSQDILSFLFKCPISKLNKLESAQVEMLIATLTIQKPEVKVSDIFTIGTGLLASVKNFQITLEIMKCVFRFQGLCSPMSL